MNFENIIYQLIHDRVVRLIPLALDKIFIRIDPEAFEDHISTVLGLIRRYWDDIVASSALSKLNSDILSSFNV